MANFNEEENDLIEEAKRNVELCKNLLYSTKQMIDRAVDLMLRDSRITQNAEVQEMKIEEAFDIINDYTIDLYYLSIRNEIKPYVDFVACWACLDDLKCAYREIVEKIKTDS